MTCRRFCLSPAALLLSITSWAFFAEAPCAAADSANASAAADSPAVADPAAKEDELLAGHSAHGEAFNSGPRQGAVLLEGMGNIDFASSAQSETAQAFINQGVAALHGFWYLEAERAFRQAAQLQPDLAIAYWGMAQANANAKDPVRAREFISKAVELRGGATERERKYIDAFAAFLKKPEKRETDAQRKKRLQQYVSALEQLLHEFPTDIDARALLALQLWSARRDLPITSHYAVDALLGEVFAANPLHPAHHYRIHLWDGVRSENALHSSAMCGPSLPAVAHMWHMPGHTYSKLSRYADAAWQQEASARVDHQHMIQTRLLPDQIHNFAHNNEWLVRNLNFLGRVEDALVQSRNLISLPRHPAYNSLSKRGSFLYGRMRLLQTLSEYELWDVLIREAEGPYLEPTSDPGLSNERVAWLIVAHRLGGEQETAVRLARGLHRERIALESEVLDLEEQLEAVEQAKRKQDKKTDQLATAQGKLKELRALIARGEAAAAVAAKDATAVEAELQRAGGVDAVLAASWLGQAGEHDGAIQRLEKLVASHPSEVRPLAVLIDQLWRADRQEEAVQRFSALRTVAAHADLQTPLLARLQGVAEKAGAGPDWRSPPEPASDIGQRPPLETLGPAVWEPYVAPAWTASAADGTQRSDDAYQGKAKLVVFYLGFGCLHCVEQLTALKPKIDQFAAAGIEIVAISTETAVELRKGIESYGQELPLTILADPSHASFRAYRCWDDFESLPLHGTFLIDAHGKVRWQDIGHEPFSEVDFLWEESQRLLALPPS